MIPAPTDEDADGPFPNARQALMLAAVGGLMRLAALVALAGSFGYRPAFFGVAALVGLGGAFALAIPRIPPPPEQTLGVVPPPRRAWLAVPFLLPALLLISELDNIWKALAPLPAEPVPIDVMSTPQLLELVLVLAVAVPVAEEVFFRGLVQPALVREWGSRLGIATVAAVQGGIAVLLSMHAAPFAFAFGLALVLGVLRHCARSIVPSIALHALCGLAAVGAAFHAYGIPGFDDVSVAHTPLGYLLSAGALVGIGLGLCRAAARDPLPEPPEPGL